MGHRHFFSTSQMFEGEQDQNWSHMHVEQPCIHLARSSSTETGTLYFPLENMSADGVHWSSASRSNGYISSGHDADVVHHPPDDSGSSHDNFLHPSVAGPFLMVPENHAHHASSSSYDRQTFHNVDGSFADLSMGNSTGPHKRKSPGIPTVCERGSTSRCYGSGSSSELPVPSEVRADKAIMDSHNIPWDYMNTNPSYRASGLSIRGDGSVRNVRSRSAVDLESNLARTQFSSNPAQNFYSSSCPIDHLNFLDLPGPSSVPIARDWSQISMSPPQGRIVTSDTLGYVHETSQFLLGSGTTSSSVEGGGYNQDFISSRNPLVPPCLQGTPTQSVRGVRSGSSQRSGTTYRPSSSSLRLGHVAPSDEGLQLAESLSRHPRPLSAIGWRGSDRNGRSRISSDRYRLLSDEIDRLASEGFMIVDRSALYGSRNMLDQHRDMRLDIDNMSYEELLALGERIGSVSTGLSDEKISKCLTESIFCSSDQMQDEGNCVICLEEYKNMDDVGTLKTCGHDYHVSCIKKWLSMKNICPICKGSALPDDMKDK